MKFVLMACLMFLSLALTGCPETVPDSKFKREEAGEEFDTVNDPDSNQQAAPKAGI